jgi:hypothetical protein
MWFVRLSVSPTPESQDFAQFAGAHVNCWLALSAEQAIVRATELIEGYKWRVDAVEETREVHRSDYEQGSQALLYFEQALVDCEVVVFYTWPNDAADRVALH